MSALSVTSEDLDITTRVVFGEARGELPLGQTAVAWVIRTRAEWSPPSWWGHTVSKVCRCPFQFSCMNPNDPNFTTLMTLPTYAPTYQALHEIVRAVMAGEVADPTGGASHYQRVGTGAGWSKGRTISALIGNHEFYALGPTG